ncbi:hypothetical protein GUJ93_ZPchr0002g23437 [Zizania palustris]|uniref:Uncharacterized protein n=1 Tax=Zizania palustris TaxID=103762 RepID=A0A8J5SH08_ZIZPA|nr:hypothetical protein GUJ93_ZPchr0002g23437 [Zizania palustris]
MGKTKPHRLSMENFFACHRCVRSRRALSPAIENPSAGLPASSRRRLTLLDCRCAGLPSSGPSASPLRRWRRLEGRCPVVRRRAERGCSKRPSSRADMASWRERSSPVRAAAKRRTSSCHGVLRRPHRLARGGT